MAFKDGVGTLTVTPYVMSAVGVVDAVQVTPVGPAYQSRPGTGHLTFIVDNNTAGNSDVELEVSTSSVFSSTVYTTSLTNIANGTYTVLATGLTSGTRYYWRVRASETGMAAWSAWSLYADGAPLPDGSPVTLSSATASGTGFGFGASNTIDGNVTTFWHAGGGTPMWLRYQMSSTEPFKVKITPRHDFDATSRSFRDFLVQGSNDGTTWTTIETFTAITGWVAAAAKTFALPPTGPWTYLRIYCTVTNGDANVGIAEVVLTEVDMVGTAGLPWEFTLAAGQTEAHENVYVNIGALNTLEDDAHETIHLNIGFLNTLNLSAGGYIYLGDIDTSTPDPHLWFLLPDSGRPLDGVDVYCTGVGDLPTTYDGVVQVKAPTEAVWVDVAVVSWQTYPATPDAYGPDRALDPIVPVIDPQHTVLSITIPSDAVPPGYQVRIRTDGP